MHRCRWSLPRKMLHIRKEGRWPTERYSEVNSYIFTFLAFSPKSSKRVPKKLPTLSQNGAEIEKTAARRPCQKEIKKMMAKTSRMTPKAEPKRSTDLALILVFFEKVAPACPGDPARGSWTLFITMFCCFWLFREPIFSKLRRPPRMIRPRH